MPNHPPMSPRRLIPLLGAALALLAAASPAGAVVGGSTVLISDHPYQVALLSNNGLSPYDAQTCGGVVLDPTHVATAAHCVYDTKDSATGQAVSPGAVQVFAGSANLKTATPTLAPVTAVSFDPRFDAATLRYDSAVLTVDLPTGDPNIAAIPIASPLPSTFTPGEAAFVTGWGATDTAAKVYPWRLNGASVPLEDDSTCEGQWSGPADDIDPATMVCAGDGNTDACTGDSGGPLVQPAAAPATGDELIGIVSFGFDGTPPCANPTHAGVYTEAPADDVRSYLSRADPGDAPRNVDPPSIGGSTTVGETLTCATGDWTGNPTGQAIQWLRGTGSGEVAVTNAGANTTYITTDNDVGEPLRCVVKRSSADGYGVARSALTAAISARPSAAPPAPQPAPEPTPEPTPVPVVLKDSTPPVAKILTARCVKQTCTLTVRVTDAGVSAGIAKVAGSVRSTYRRDGRTRHRTRTFTARRTASTRFTVRLTKLPVGTQQFMLLATDNAGHRQLLPTRTTLRTRR